MSIQAWASRTRSSELLQSTESQRLIDAFESFLLNECTAEDAANNIASILEPIIRGAPSDVRHATVWSVLCDAIRELGSDLDISRHLINLLDTLRQIEVKDGHGDILKHEWGGSYWTNLPTFALHFREYGIDVESDLDMEIEEWLAQKSPFLNATSFAALCLSNSSNMSGMAFYVSGCMGELQSDPDITPEMRYRSALYVPAAAAWITISGQKIYELCKNMEWSLDQDKWESWERSLGEIAVDDQVKPEIQEISLQTKDKMIVIRNKQNQ
ncbi:hypothetical protein F5Y04DRAFT_275013 [Hypomontagnella monticulosa]|nr:hypothetical protein F5Y04DRAFT_275013 [Hypomontagnella monticulosa]